MKAAKILLAAAYAATALTTNAQSLFVKQTDGTVHEYAVETVQEVAFGASTDNLGKYAITYKANDGTEASATQQGIEGKVFTIGEGVSFTAPENKEFVGWNTAADGSGVQCANGEMISLSRSLTLYAQWVEYVDLGLSVKWATCNVGATKPEEYGHYFAWGETQPKTDYSWSTYKYGTDYNQLTKYCNDSSYGKDGFTDSKTVIDPADDAATANWGGKWRMPTYAEIDELFNNCTWEWTERNGVYGRVATSNVNGNSIFLPAAGFRNGANLYLAGSWGYYWSASLYDYLPYGAFYLYFNSDYQGWDYYDRYYGRTVRAVCP